MTDPRLAAARLLLSATSFSVSDVACMAGFSGVRSLEHALGADPLPLRSEPASGAGVVRLRLPFVAPLEPSNLFGHLVATAVPGVEEWRDGAYRRTMRLAHGAGIVALAPGDRAIGASLRLDDLRDLPSAIRRCREVLDLDVDPHAVDAHLATDQVLAAAVQAVPGRRVPRSVDADEMAIRAVLGQQVSTAAARTHAGRLVAAHGTPVDDPDGGLTHLFPAPADLVDLDPASLALPQARRRTLLGLVAALAEGRVDLGADLATCRADLAGLQGIGPWTVEVVAMRGLGDPDAFCGTDLGVVAAARHLGLPTTPRGLQAAAERWRPWRAYAVQHLWATGDHPVNRMPAEAAANHLSAEPIAAGS